MLSNNGTNGAWEDNVLQFLTHGMDYAYGYYGGNLSDAGCAMIVTQGNDIVKLQIGNYNAAPIEFFTDNTFRVRIDTGGNVGIGTDSPAEALHVVGTSLFANEVKIGSLGDNPGILNVYTNDASDQSAQINLKNGSFADRLSLSVNDDFQENRITSTSNSLYIDATAIVISASQTNIDNLLVAENLHTSKRYTETVAAISISSNTLTVNLNTCNLFTCPLNANITGVIISNTPATSGRAIGFSLIFTADGTARSVTWPSGVKWAGGTAPTLTSTNGKIDVLSFLTTNNGTNWFGFVGGQNY
jgi:hypothetical protein